MDEGMLNLKPCPFCGSTAELTRTHEDGYFIDCSSDHCPGVAAAHYGTMFAAALAWNTRFGEDALEHKLQIAQEEHAEETADFRAELRAAQLRADRFENAVDSILTAHDETPEEDEIPYRLGVAIEEARQVWVMYETLKKH